MALMERMKRESNIAVDEKRQIWNPAANLKEKTVDRRPAEGASDGRGNAGARTG